jgi:hypothetical protein
MINTYNESFLHSEIKLQYAKQFNGKTEVKIDNYICDIISEDKIIIEIQTGSFSNICAKLFSLTQKYKVKLVYPMQFIKHIEKYDSNGKFIERRKSPKKMNLYSAFDELMYIYPVLLSENFSLDILFCETCEKRVILKEKTFLSKKSKFPKAFNKEGKNLENIMGQITLQGKADYLALFPKDLPEIFCTSDLFNHCGKKNSYKFMWVMKKLEVVDFVKKEKNKNYYRLVK